MKKVIEKAKEAKETKNKLMLVSGKFNAKQLLAILQKTPKNHIYHRPAKGKGEWDYVTGVYIKKMLNYVFGWMWDFEIKEHGREGDLIWTLGRLTIRDRKGQPMIIKEQFGRADIKYYRDKSKGILDYGNDLKAASTDALKKCASELGIASDVYGKNEFREIEQYTDVKPKEDNFERAKQMIETSQNPDGLVDYAQKLTKSSFTTQQKKELNDLISRRVDELQ